MRGQILLRIDLGVALIAFFWAPCLGLHAGVQGVPGSVGTSLHDLKILETHDFYLGRRDKRVLRLDKARVVGLNHGGNLTTQEQPDPVEWEGPLRLTPLCRSHVRKYQELLGDPASTLADGNWWAFKSGFKFCVLFLIHWQGTRNSRSNSSQGISNLRSNSIFAPAYY